MTARAAPLIPRTLTAAGHVYLFTPDGWPLRPEDLS